MAEENQTKPAENADPQLQVDKSKIDYAPQDAKAGSYKFYPDNPESSFNKFRFAAKDVSQFYDPCQESSKMSMKCLELNDYDRSMCQEYFDAYRECKKQWLQARRKNRSQWE